MPARIDADPVMWYLPEVTPLTRVFQSVATNSTSTPRSLASSVMTSMSYPVYALVAGSRIVIGFQSPVVPTLRTPAFRISFSAD